ncbi:uncharacterized protein [Spinacia oleracea]|uniref:Uncharacterized protein n=1 Tax=Spinacia oleracea TaxID=3562 RepID=A0ABM3QI02_SPIOL|nr:uncharacterized protein LOC130459564 [Spinacia oleracea]
MCRSRPEARGSPEFVKDESPANGRYHSRFRLEVEERLIILKDELLMEDITVVLDLKLGELLIMLKMKALLMEEDTTVDLLHHERGRDPKQGDGHKSVTWKGCFWRGDDILSKEMILNQYLSSAVFRGEL